MSDSVAHRPGARRRRAARRLVQLLVLLLVPVLIVTAPNTAEAATVKYSGQHAASWSYDQSSMPGDWANCSVSFVYVVTGNASAGYSETVKNQGGDCSTGFDLDWQGAALELTAKGVTGTGAACSTAGTVTMGTDEVIPASELAGGLLPGTADSLCRVGTLCWHVTKSGSFLTNAVDAAGCTPLPMGTPELPSGDDGATSSCPHGTPQQAFAKQIPEYPGFPGFRQVGGMDIKGVPSNVPAWGMRYIWQVSPLGFYNPQGAAYPSGQANAGYYWPTADPAPTYGPNGHLIAHAITGNYGSSLTVIGVQVYVSNMSQADSALQVTGYTRPSVCSFYFGPKIVQDTSTTEDDPFAAMSETAAAPDPTATEPVAPTPTTDPPAGKCSGILGAGFCAVVDALTAVWHAITGLGDYLAALPGRILDGITSLFTFTPGYLDGKLTQIHNAWSQTSPGMWVDSFTGWLVMPTDSSCGGIPVDYTLPGKDIHMDIGEACSGKMASAAAIVKIGISAMVVVGGAMMCMRLVGAGIYDVPGSFGRRDSED